MTNLRAAAARVIEKVVEGHSLTEVLPLTITQYTDVRDQRLLQAICYGVCRWYHRLNEILKLLLKKPLKEKDQDIHCLLLVGLYQLNDMRIPEHAVVAETVSATHDLKKSWAKHLVNGVLRHYIRQRTELEKKLNKNDQALYSHPQWIMDHLKKSWPEDWQAILTANNEHPPFSLRVNQSHQSRDAYLLRLSGQADTIPVAPMGIILADPVDVKQLPGFDKGDVSVQDGAAQLAVELLNVSPGQRILDACAAPGGKTGHLLEKLSFLSGNKKDFSSEVTALDIDAARLQKIRDNVSRLQLSAHCVVADAARLEDWWDGKLFDRILLDAPCSASGVIRRHPDIKLLRREADIGKLLNTQTHLLDLLWTILAPGGLMLYVTCSVFPEENTHRMEQFFAKHPEAKEKQIIASWGKKCVVGRQILPGMENMDGFYFAICEK
jgi:16S rRNA (cytosine967-C5)-methyltransferase